MLSPLHSSAARHVQTAEVVTITPAVARPPLSLRVSVTDRCSLRCTYCMPANGVPVVPREQVLSYEEILRFVCELKARYGLAQVRLTGGEPLVRPQVERLVTMLAAAGLSDLALTTNGQQLASMAERLKQAGLTRINISLDTLRPEAFAAITRGGILQKTLDGIAAARQVGLYPIKLNTVVMRGWNDHEITDLLQFALEHDCQMRFLELMPIGVAAATFDKCFVSTAEVREQVLRKFTLKPLPFATHETSRNFLAEDGQGRTAVVGFISPYSQPFCAGCWRLRLTATGVLIGCLARSEGVPIAPLLRSDVLDGQELAAAVERALAMKRRDGEFTQPRAMVAIGG
jgi:GTP 3',8-cyclase